MEGIAEMFAELAEQSEYDAQLTLEWWLHSRLERAREYHRDQMRWYRRVKHASAKAAMDHKSRRKYYREYKRRKRLEDPASYEREKAAKRARMARLRAEQKPQQHAAQAA